MAAEEKTPDLTPWALGLYVREVGRQCRIGLIAAEELELQLTRLTVELETLRAEQGYAQRSAQIQFDAKRRILAAVQGLLVASALVSRLLWPSQPLIKEDKIVRRRMKQRGQMLRKILRMQGDSPLRSRALRDSLEHFDERLDVWLIEKGSVIEDDNFYFGVAAPVNENVLRSFSGTGLVFAFENQTIPLRETINALRDLLTRVEMAEHTQ